MLCFIYSIIDAISVSNSIHKVGSPSIITLVNFVLLFFLTILLLLHFRYDFLLHCYWGGSLVSFFWHVVISLLSTSCISTMKTISYSEDEPSMKPAFNCSVVPDWVKGGRPIIMLNLLFFSKSDSPFFLWLG